MLPNDDPTLTMEPLFARLESVLALAKEQSFSQQYPLGTTLFDKSERAENFYKETLESGREF